VATPQDPMPDGDRVREALRRVRVTTACVRPSNARGREVLQEAGYRDPRRIGQLVCLFPDRSMRRMAR
jgi:hypothetical protein